MQKYVASMTVAAAALLAGSVGCSGAESTGEASAADTSQAWKGHGGGGGQHARESVVVEWNEAARDAIRVTGAGPTIAARALAEMHTAIYDAWAAYSQKATPATTGAPARRPAAERTDANRRTAIGYAAYRALVDLFPAEAAHFDRQLTQLGGSPKNTSADPATAAGVGNAAAAAVIAFRHADASNQLGDITPGAYSDYTGYAPVNTPDAVNDPNRWQPLRVGGAVQTFLTPQWQNVLPFALTDPAAFRPAPPPAFGTAAYRDQAEELVRISARLDDRRKVIAEYWSDGPGTSQSPGHWARFAQFVSASQDLDLDDDVKLFFALSSAMLDTSIAVWESKRFYDSERPITAIRTLFGGKPIRAWGGPNQGTRTIDGAKFLPYERADVVTPPSPEYAAEESAFAFAAAEVLRRFTGSDRFGEAFVAEERSSHIEPGRTPRCDVKLCFKTFSSAARQAGRAGQLRGVHFAKSDAAGRVIGAAVGMQSYAAALALWGVAHEQCHHAHHEDCDEDDLDRDDERAR